MGVNLVSNICNTGLLGLICRLVGWSVSRYGVKNTLTRFESGYCVS